MKSLADFKRRLHVAREARQDAARRVAATAVDSPEFNEWVGIECACLLEIRHIQREAAPLYPGMVLV